MKRQNIIAAAIAIVMSGMTLSEAKAECENLGDRLCVCEDESARQELSIMQECVELLTAEEQAQMDMEDEA